MAAVRHTAVTLGLGDAVRKDSGTTLERHWGMLQLLPRAPYRITAAELAVRLKDRGHTISKRSIERDLQQLSTHFPIELDERAKPFGWSWQRDAASFSVPGMTPLQAVVLLTAEAHLKPLLPANQLAELRPLLDQAKRTIATTPGSDALGPWPSRVAVASTNQPLLPPVVHSAVLVAVHTALYMGRQLEVSYQARYEDAPKPIRLHPMGLIQRGGVMYLVCRMFNYTDPRIIVLHRMHSATVLEDPAKIPAGFRLKSMLPEVSSGFDPGKPVRLVLRMVQDAARHLFETPLSTDQRISAPDGSGWVTIKATVSSSAQLRWWLLGFGEGVEVVAPVGLRRTIAAQLEAASKQYAGTA